MITYSDDLSKFSDLKVDGFFVGWPNPPSNSTFLSLLNNSYKYILAIDKDSHSLIGFVTAVSDGVLSAYIPLLEVLPEYQSKAIGKELMSLMLKKLNHLYMIDLVCDEDLQSYYQRLGMTKAYACSIRNYSRQSGAKAP